MARYLDRICPRCGDYLGIVVSQRILKEKEQPVNGLCAVCGYQLNWKVIPGKKSRPRQRTTVTALRPFLAVFLAFLLLAPVASSGEPITGKVEVHYIDVGQADAILVMSSNRECVMLIDSGDTRYPGSSKKFKAYIQSKLPLGSRIDLAVASHPHADHIGSMRWVLQNYDVRTYIDNGQQHDTDLYSNLMAEIGGPAKEKGLKYFPYDQAGTKEQDFCPAAENLDSILLYPSGGYDPAVCNDNQNNCSLVVKMIYGNTSFLFPGDAEERQEKLLLEDQAVREKLPSQVLKAPHHGSNTSSSTEFLTAISPQWLVVSVGKKETGTNTTYKHPSLSTIRNLLLFAGEQINQRDIDAYDKDIKAWVILSVGGNLFVTTKDGTVVLSSDGKEIRRQ